MGSVVAFEAMCQQAAAQLGEIYYFERSGEQYPAGCYCYFSNPGIGPFYFNSIIDPLLTSNIPNFYRALCNDEGT